MGRYSKIPVVRKEKPAPNPLWRGFGCIIMVALPLVTFGLTLLAMPLLIATGDVPYQLLGYINFSAWVFKVPGLSDVAIFLRGIDNLWLGLSVFFVILILLTGAFSFIYVAVMQFIGPPRYSEKDAPPPKYKAKPYKR